MFGKNKNLLSKIAAFEKIALYGKKDSFIQKISQLSDRKHIPRDPWGRKNIAAEVQPFINQAEQQIKSKFQFGVNSANLSSESGELTILLHAKNGAQTISAEMRQKCDELLLNKTVDNIVVKRVNITFMYDNEPVKKAAYGKKDSFIQKMSQDHVMKNPFEHENIASQIQPFVDQAVKEVNSKFKYSVVYADVSSETGMLNLKLQSTNDAFGKNPQLKTKLSDLLVNKTFNNVLIKKVNALFMYDGKQN